MAADPEETPAIRRGKGLRLSAQAEPQTPPADSPPAPAEGPPPPVSRRRGLRLSTQTPEPQPAPEVAAPPKPRRSAPARPAAKATPAPPPAARAAPPPAAEEVPIGGVATDIRSGGLPQPERAGDRWRITTPTGPIFYTKAGEGRPLLLIHGFGASGRIWNDTSRALAPLRTTYALDLPGFGASPPRAAAPTLSFLADEVLAWADALGLASFDLLGHALGAAVAALVTARQPGRVGRLLAASLGARPFAPELAALGLSRAPFDLTLGLSRPLLNFWQPLNRAMMQTPPLAMTVGSMVLHNQSTSGELWHDYLADHAASDPRAYLTSLTAVGDPALIAALRAISAPTLCIAGREDRVARINETLEAQRLISGSRLRLLEGCGHMPMIEQPVAFHAALREFLGA